MSKTITSDALITEADIQAFKDEVNRGVFKDIVYDQISREPELAVFVADRYSKILTSLQEAGIEGRRLSAICKHVCLMSWGSAILIARSQRRQWDGFMPVEESTEKGGGQ